MHVCYLFWPSPDFKRRKIPSSEFSIGWTLISASAVPHYGTSLSVLLDLRGEFFFFVSIDATLKVQSVAVFSSSFWVVRLLLAKYYSVGLSAEAAISAVPMLSRLVFKTAVAGWWWCQLHFSVHKGVESVVALAYSNDHKIKNHLSAKS